MGRTVTFDGVGRGAEGVNRFDDFDGGALGGPGLVVQAVSPVDSDDGLRDEAAIVELLGKPPISVLK